MDFNWRLCLCCACRAVSTSPLHFATQISRPPPGPPHSMEKGHEAHWKIADIRQTRLDRFASDGGQHKPKVSFVSGEEPTTANLSLFCLFCLFCLFSSISVPSRSEARGNSEDCQSGTASLVVDDRKLLQSTRVHGRPVSTPHGRPHNAGSPTPNHPPASNQLQALGAQPCPKVCESDSHPLNPKLHRQQPPAQGRAVKVPQAAVGRTRLAVVGGASHKPRQATISVKMSGVGRQVSLRDIESENDRS